MQADERLDTLVILDRHVACAATPTWELALPNGAYIVELTYCDTQYGGDTDCSVEGTSANIGHVEPCTDLSGTWSDVVTVLDGKLTLTGRFGVNCASVNSIIILRPTA